MRFSLLRYGAVLLALVTFLPASAADLAIAYANVGRYKDAIRVLNSVLAWSLNLGLTERSRSMILQMQAYPDASAP